MELHIFGRFHVHIGKEAAFQDLLTAVVTASSQESGCLEIHGYRSTREARLFYLHSHWTNESAFDEHARMPHTVRFIEGAQALIDHDFGVTRAERIA
ncbi:MAG TPA: putative quinol monooxygenase [Candidatus Eremiobacteraceae bacterium]|nr:putative quinol monooxygenase [Candidatus Eremiobacteraceae bacterium]